MLRDLKIVAPFLIGGLLMVMTINFTTWVLAESSEVVLPVAFVVPRPYVYKATVKDVHDGDSITVDVQLGFNVLLQNMKLRLAGINAPELTTAEGKKVRDFLSKILLNKEIVLQTVKDRQEKYGRYLAIVWLDGKNVNEQLVKGDMAVPYDGGKRD
ncbi:MAG: thermonuclease family protein [Candidatus Nanopelagicaceae bacterium]|nr:thermonuclease family protein [Candidatus Nanopelagicaceae bacterium]